MVRIYQRMILVVGYFDRNNIGDDALKIAVAEFIGEGVDMINIDDLHLADLTKYCTLALGPGDVFTDYFVERFSPYARTFNGRVIALGVGFPFKSMMTDPSIALFDKFYLRNVSDVDDLGSIIGYDKVEHIPDLCLLSSTLTSVPRLRRRSNTICVSLIQSVASYDFVISGIVNLLSNLAKTYNIILVRFDSSGSSDNDDQFINQKVFSKISYSVRSKITVDNTVYTPQQMIALMSSCSSAICMRFHAHIFSMLAGTPFMSISFTRKVTELMRQSGLGKNMYDVDRDVYAKPRSFSYTYSLNLFNSILRSWDTSIVPKYLQYCSRFVNLYVLNHCENDPVEIVQRSGLTDPNQIASLVSFMITGNFDSSYNYGFAQSYSPSTLRAQIDWIKNDWRENGSTDVVVDNPNGIYTFDMNNYRHLKSLHRSGWWWIIENISTYRNVRGQPLDLYMDATFHWNRNLSESLGVIPYRKTWSGFIHHPDSDRYSVNNTIALFEVQSFLDSLIFCDTIFVMSNTLAQYITSKKKELGLSFDVRMVNHPILPIPRTFSIDKYRLNTRRRLVQIGAWMRRPFTIYRLRTNMEKYVLQGKKMDGMVPPQGFTILPTDSGLSTVPEVGEDGGESECRAGALPIWTNDLIRYLLLQGFITQWRVDGPTLYVVSSNISTVQQHVQSLISSVTIIPCLDNDQYDNLFVDSVIFLDLVRVAAVNTILECISTNTPVIVNREVSVEEILGSRYPLYNNYNTELNVSDSDVIAAQKYLSSMDKTTLDIQRFINAVML